MTSYDVQGQLNAQVRIGRGRLEVRAAEEGRAGCEISAIDPDDADAVAAAADATAELRGDRLTVDVHRRQEHRPPPVLIVLTIPIGSSLKASAGDLDVEADVPLDEVDLRLGNGDVELSDVDQLRVKAGNVSLAAGDVDELNVAAGNAEVAAGSVRDARWRAGAGSLALGASSGQVTAKGGQVELTIAATAGGAVDFRAAAGSATIGVVEGTDVHLDLVSAVGDVACTLPVGTDAPSGGAPLSLRLHTGAGDLRVHRSGEEPPPVSPRGAGHRGFPDIGRVVEDAMANVQVQLDRAGLSGIRIDASGDRSRPRWADRVERIARRHAGTTRVRYAGPEWGVDGDDVDESHTFLDGHRVPVDGPVSDAEVRRLRDAGYDGPLVDQLPVDGPWTVPQLLTVCRAGLDQVVELVGQLPVDGPLEPETLAALVKDGLAMVVERIREARLDGPVDPDDLLPRFGSESV